MFSEVCKWRNMIQQPIKHKIAGHVRDKNSSGDEIANVNFFYNNAHVEANAYAHWTSS